MHDWEWESVDRIVTDQLFRVTNAGPLHAPVKSFSIRRNDKLGLVLETQAPGDAKSAIPPPPAGTVRMSTHTVELTGSTNYKAVLHGVESHGTMRTFDPSAGTSEVREEASFDRVEVTFDGDREHRYTIDWLENVSRSPFSWPHSVSDGIKTTKTRTFESNADDFIISGSGDAKRSSRQCVKFEIDGIQMYLSALSLKAPNERVRPGCIVYLGTPDDKFREKIRHSISFALGMYLVYLGSSSFDENWHLISFTSVSGYSLAMRAFDLPALPPAPLTSSNRLWEINPQVFTRVVKALFDNYDMLQFQSLSWQYWHALCATMHIAGVHFGAAIEALQRSYIDAHNSRFQTALIADRVEWKKFRMPIFASISALPVSDQIKRALCNKIGGLNEPPVRMMTEQLLKEIGITIGRDELRAWEDRNRAAHGHHPEHGTELQIIRDMKLLRVLFNRMLLRITSASDKYYDYCSLDMPIRNLSDPIPSMPTSQV